MMYPNPIARLWMVAAFLFVLPGIARADADPPMPVYTEDVAPILKESCQVCHRPGEAVPMTFTSYSEVRPWARSIKNVVANREMPPWLADSRIGHFENERTLTEEEVRTIVRWVDAGAPRGPGAADPLALPIDSPERDHQEWQIGKPDFITGMQEEIVLPVGEEEVLTHLLVPVNLDRDVWISALEIKPGNPEVIHHANLRIVPANSEERPTVAYLAVYAPGYRPTQYGPGEAFLLPKHHDLVLGMHYFKDKDVEARDLTQIGLKYARGPVRVRRDVAVATNEDFVIPANHDNYPVTAMRVIIEPNARLEGLMPHMHTHGRDMRIWAEFPDGRLQPLLYIPKWDFDWQLVYDLEESIPLPLGTIIVARCHYNNSESNPLALTPDREVTSGPRTTQEMATLGLFISQELEEPVVQFSLFGN